MDKKTIYFHIGTHKTGSTALQKFFVDNRSVLKSKGLIYDFYDEKEMNQGYLAFNPEKWESLILNKSNNYIISGEDFYSHLIESSEVIREKLKEFHIHFIVYFKRQDLMLESVYNQLVKMHGFTENIHQNIHYNFNYYNFLQKLKDRFPESTYSVQVYEKLQFNGGTIFSDFLKILGLDLTNEYHIEQKVINPSLTTEKMEFTRYINMLNLPIDFRTQISHLIINSALNDNEVSLFRKQNIISPEEAKQFLSQYKDDNNKIAQEFLDRTDARLFYEDIAEDSDWKRFSGLSPKVALEILQQINKMDNQVLENLYELIVSTPEANKKFVEAANFLTPLLINILKKNIIFQPFIVKNLKLPKNFEQLKQNLEGEQESADILREVALAFEESGDIQTALKVMQQACILRPEGPAIKQKVNTYKELLDQ